jgi:hypothetical protein
MEEGLLLTGKGGVGQVFGGGAGADRHVAVRSVLLFEFSVGGANLLAQPSR